MEPELIQNLADWGGTLGSLLACFWYIRYLTDHFSEERQQWMAKDSESDQALRELMQNSNAQLMDVMRETNKILQDMKVAISELKETIHHEAQNG
jgi:mevalonate kinase